MRWSGKTAVRAAVVVVATVTASAGQAQDDEVDALKSRVDKLERKLERVEAEARSEEQRLNKWHLAGYADVGFLSSDQDGVEDSFTVGHFNPVFHWMYDDFLLFESELEIEAADDGSTEVALEYAQLDYILNDRLVLVAGKYLSPVGQFQERLHPTWVNKLPDPPAGFGHGGVQPLTDIGVQARGNLPVGGMLLTGVVAIGNGPQGGHHGVELEGFGADNNDDKAVSGRFAILPIPSLEFGASFLTADVPGEQGDATGPVTEGDYDLWGADLAWTKGPWDVRAEYLDSELGEFFGAATHDATTTSLIAETEWEAWYVQAARQFGKWEPVIRYGEFDAEGTFTDDARTAGAVGLNYLFAPSLVGKVAFQQVDPDDPASDEYDELRLQLAYGF